MKTFQFISGYQVKNLTDKEKFFFRKLGRKANKSKLIEINIYNI